jgi:hypothetical protein
MRLPVQYYCCVLEDKERQGRGKERGTGGERARCGRGERGTGEVKERKETPDTVCKREQSVHSLHGV